MAVIRDRRRAVSLVTVLAILLLAAQLSSSTQARASGSTVCGSTSGTIRHVVWVIFENRSYGQVVGHAPYIDTLAGHCGQATNMHNVSHPSLPNYLAMTSGLPPSQLPTNDCLPSACPVNATSIFAQNSSWAVYAESMPSNCYRQDSGSYRVHHTPAPYYPLSNCTTDDRPLSALNPGSLPRFTVIVPNVVNDMHENTSSVSAGDTWLSRHLPPILGSSAYQAGTVAVFLTWDEGGFPRSTRNCTTNTSDEGCHILTVVLTHGMRHLSSSVLFNHYSLLRTAEELLGYPLLGKGSAYPSMRAAFGL
jgi:phospholipase C